MLEVNGLHLLGTALVAYLVRVTLGRLDFA
jgi:hypothetical protein